MKFPIFASSILVSTLVANPAFAERSANQQALVEGGTFSTLTFAGAVAGGPIGMIVGAFSGALLAQETRAANDREIALQEQKLQSTKLEETLLKNEQNIAQLQQELVQKLTFQILFATGDDSLNELDKQRVGKLAKFLQDNPNLHVQLDGYTDIRGTDEYNNVLSFERAKSINEALIEQGVDAARIKFKGHGSTFASATKGDDAEYAKDRKVMIQLLSEGSSDDSVVQY